MHATEDPPPVTEERSPTRAAHPEQKIGRRAGSPTAVHLPGSRSEERNTSCSTESNRRFWCPERPSAPNLGCEAQGADLPFPPVERKRRCVSQMDSPHGGQRRGCPSSGHPSARSPRGHSRNLHEPREENSGITRKEAARCPGFVPSGQPRTPGSPGTHLGSGGGCSGGPGAGGRRPGGDPASPRRDSRECRAAPPGRGLYPKEEGDGTPRTATSGGGWEGGKGAGPGGGCAAAPLLLRSAPAGVRHRPRGAPRPPGGSAARSAPHRGTGESGERLPKLESPRGARRHGALGSAVTPAALRAAAAGGGAGSRRSVGSSCGCSVGCGLGEGTE